MGTYHRFAVIVVGCLRQLLVASGRCLNDGGRIVDGSGILERANHKRLALCILEGLRLLLIDGRLGGSCVVGLRRYFHCHLLARLLILDGRRLLLLLTIDLAANGLIGCNHALLVLWNLDGHLIGIGEHKVPVDQQGLLPEIGREHLLEGVRSARLARLNQLHLWHHSHAILNDLALLPVGSGESILYGLTVHHQLTSLILLQHVGRREHGHTILVGHLLLD